MFAWESGARRSKRWVVGPVRWSLWMLFAGREIRAGRVRQPGQPGEAVEISQGHADVGDRVARAGGCRDDEHRDAERGAGGRADRSRHWAPPDFAASHIAPRSEDASPAAGVRRSSNVYRLQGLTGRCRLPAARWERRRDWLRRRGQGERSRHQQECFEHASSCIPRACKNRPPRRSGCSSGEGQLVRHILENNHGQDCR
jgi:hypothetical protein